MKTATETLRHEHDAILQMLDATEEVAHQLQAGVPVEPRILDGLLEFFRLFADQCHHGKEERHFFPALEAKGFSRQHGPTGVMLHEHDEGRLHIAALASAVELAEAGDGQALGQFVRHARAYVRLLREHIQKEDQRLFPMALEELA